MSDNNVVLEQSGAVLIITMNRPEKKNALTSAMYTAMANALAEADKNDAIRVVMIQGYTDAFTAGNDLGDFLKEGLGLDSPVMTFLRQLVAFEKPLVAAVSGVAVGIGVTMLLHCDLVYVAKNSKLRLPFVNLALVPEAASSLLLPEVMGHQRASELLMLGDFFSADTARDYGIANDSVDTDHVFEEALAKAELLATKPAEALKATKKLLKQSYRSDVEKRIADEGIIFAERLQSDEAREIMSAFMGKA
ncbi:enoyl-CoA hydratase [Endozoicomonas arenosclerae]|uniref:enoyl-CoA hydratase n=1 Tax=Endozoicomonas arenosclerae TaxID=1633495 RepID=UPI0009A1C5A5|nr:enoyl-CoA hydratase [Endozoicomonas arenosclerae]